MDFVVDDHSPVLPIEKVEIEVAFRLLRRFLRERQCGLFSRARLAGFMQREIALHFLSFLGVLGNCFREPGERQFAKNSLFFSMPFSLYLYVSAHLGGTGCRDGR